MPKDLQIHTFTQEIFEKVVPYIEKARTKIAVVLNSEITVLYWQMGRQMEEYILQGERATYGKQIVSNLAKQIAIKYGAGFSYSALTRMIHFYKLFPDAEMVATLSQELTWSHFVELLPIEDGLKRSFYLELCRKEHWTIRTMRKKIDTMLYERTALSLKPEETIAKELEILKEEGTSTPDLVFRSPYILHFLGLKNTYREEDLETAILNHLQDFIIELGSDFAFLARQKRIIIDEEDFYIDLLFYHRGLKRLIAIDLKLGKFKAAYKGQMELYLRWLDKYERKTGEESPIGLILCAEKRQEQIELLELAEGNIRVAEYLTTLPPKEVLAEKLHLAIEIARNNQH